MTDTENMARFIMLRSQGWSFNRIATEFVYDVHKWSA